MADLLDQESVDEFRAAMRDVTDTFHQSPVKLLRANGAEVDLLAGVKGDDGSSDGEVNGELQVRQERSDLVERWSLSFNRDYLLERGLIDLEAEPARQLLITMEDVVVMKGRRFAILALVDKGLFRGVPILVRLLVAR